ncbi:MAG: hypothetical protein KY437_04765 [Actinobacteria bacterium]|nr:hypothetical protein [Actinomycetota bacterium]
MYDYAGGKEDWLAAGWPTEGHAGQHATAATAADDDVPTCGLDDQVSDVDLDHPVGFALVLNEERIVLGKVLPRHVEGQPDSVAREVMIEGPTTVRGSEDLDGLTSRMEDAETSSVVVTTKEGELIGVLGIQDAYDALRGGHT